MRNTSTGITSARPRRPWSAALRTSGDTPRTPPSEEGAATRASVWLSAICTGGLVVVQGLPGLGRAFDYDGSLTYSEFVATPSMLDPLRHQNRFNNHPLFSLVAHTLHSATDSRSEAAFRLIPILFGALAVGLLTAVLVRRLSLASGIVGGLFLALNPEFVDLTSKLRGYSLVVLAGIASTLVLLRARREPSWGAAALWAASAAVGPLTHLHALWFVVGQMLWLVWYTDPSSWWRAWRWPAVLGPRWTAAALGVATVTAVLYGQWLHTFATQSKPLTFDRVFPVRLAGSMLGGSLPAAALAGGVLATLVPMARRRGWILPGATWAAIAVGAPWVGARILVYNRFYVWAVALVATGVAVATHRRPVLLAPAAAALVAMAVTGFPQLGVPYLRNREAATIVEREAAAGNRVCAFAWNEIPLRPYTARYRPVFVAAELEGCDVVVLPRFSGRPAKELLPTVKAMLPVQTLLLGARTPGFVYSRGPLHTEGPEAHLLGEGSTTGERLRRRSRPAAPG